MIETIVQQIAVNGSFELTSKAKHFLNLKKRHQVYLAALHASNLIHAFNCLNIFSVYRKFESTFLRSTSRISI